MADLQALLTSISIVSGKLPDSWTIAIKQNVRFQMAIIDFNMPDIW